MKPLLRIAALALGLWWAVPQAMAQWQPDGALVCGAKGDQSGPDVIPDASGGVVIAWQDTRSDTSIGVYLQRLNNAGVTQWLTSGVFTGAKVAGEYAFPPNSMVSDGSGGAIVAWIDHRGSPST